MSLAMAFSSNIRFEQVTARLDPMKISEDLGQTIVYIDVWVTRQPHEDDLVVAAVVVV